VTDCDTTRTERTVPPSQVALPVIECLLDLLDRSECFYEDGPEAYNAGLWLRGCLQRSQADLIVATEVA
jgi:hypothetical protein